jgi:competence transcription factor ComK
MAHWINTTVTTPKGPQAICINCDHIKYIRQRDNGQALIVFASGQAEVIDDSYAKVINLIVPPNDVREALAQHMEVLDQT